MGFGVVALVTLSAGFGVDTLGSAGVALATGSFGSGTGLGFGTWTCCSTTAGSSVSIGDGISSSSSILELDPEGAPPENKCNKAY